MPPLRNKPPPAGIAGHPPTPLRVRLRRRWHAFVALDERLHERMEASRALVVVAFVVFWAGWLLLAAVFWTMVPEARVSAKAYAVLLVLGAAGTVAFRRRLRAMLLAQRRREGQCLACGYDLRESPERCPECGTWPDEDADGGAEAR